jgi:uncharacterized protein
MKRTVAHSVARLALGLWMLCALAGAGAAQPVEQAYDLETASGTLKGTLMRPPAEGPLPVVLIIAGSGPTDRDGNNTFSGRNDSLKMLAAALADAGFASLRYDKRGLGASRAAVVSESALRFDTYVDDATAWIGKLRSDPRFGRVIVVGHSEGALIGMLAAQRGNTAAYISLAGIAEGFGVVLRKQMNGKLPPDLAAANERILMALEHGQTTEDVPAVLMRYYRPSVQPYLISVMKYAPAAQLAALHVPTLIVQGTADIQVGVEQARALKAAKPDATLVLIPGMNHVLKEVGDDAARQQASYSNPDFPLSVQLTGAIVDFLRKLPAEANGA